MRLRPVLATSALAAALLLAVSPVPLVAAADLPLTVDGPLPRLGERGPADDAPDGLAIAPAITEVRPTPGRRTELVHVVTNGTDAPLTFALDVPTAPLGSDGPRLDALDDPPAPPLTDGEPARVVASTDQLTVPAGHGAELRSIAEADEGASGIYGLRATLPDGDAAIAWVVVADAGLATDLELSLHDPRDHDQSADQGEPSSLATLEVAVLRHAVVDVRLRVRSWSGVLQDLTLNDLLVGPEAPRTVTVDRPASALPGPLTVEVIATTRDGEVARADLDAAAGITPSLIAGTLVVLALLAIALVARRRHLRSDRPTHVPTDEPTEEPTP
jgi:hypothetical protein